MTNATKAMMRANIVTGRCGVCKRTVRDGCSHIECPHRRATLATPRESGATPVRRPPGSYDWNGDGYWRD